jgi:hypothetical protein
MRQTRKYMLSCCVSRSTSGLGPSSRHIFWGRAHAQFGPVLLSGNTPRLSSIEAGARKSARGCNGMPAKMSIAGRQDAAALVASVNHSISATAPLVRNADYPVTDFVGSCFLRLCLWVELITSWTRRKQVLPEFPEKLRFSPVVKVLPSTEAATANEALPQIAGAATP